jgi:multiple sugar transport system substrate-binding protein
MANRLTRRQFVGASAASATAVSMGLPRLGRRSALAATELDWAVNAWAPTETSLVQQVVDNYVAGHTDVSVSVLGYDSTAYDTKLLADIAAGTLPDIFVNADIWTKPFFEAGLTADLKPLADAAGFDLNLFDQKFLDLARDGDKVGFLPRAADVVVLYYNKPKFDEAGIAYPDDTWTIPQMLEAAEKLTKKADDGTTTQYGASAACDWWAYWVPMVVAEGGQILSEDGKTAVFNSPEGVRAWDYIFTALKNGWFVPPSVQNSIGGPWTPFANGTAAMTFTIRGLCPQFREQLPDEFDVALMPAGSVSRTSGMGTMGYSISATTENIEAAWDLLHYTYTEGMKVFMETYLLVPPISTFYDDPTWKNLPPPPTNNEVFVKALDYAILPPPLRFYDTGPFLQSVKDGIDAVVLGQMTTQEAVDRMAAEASNALQSS